MSFTHFILSILFTGTAALMLFAAWAALVLGHQAAWKWVSRKFALRHDTMGAH